MNTDMPEWLAKPRSLSTTEIKQPEIVFARFFEKYDLPLFRLELNDWLKEAPQFIQFSEEIERIVEGAWCVAHSHTIENFLKVD